jgi:hypothetical protein
MVAKTSRARQEEAEAREKLCITGTDPDVENRMGPKSVHIRSRF